MLLKREVEKYQTLIKKGGALNELNHPSASLIDLDRVYHSILETYEKDNKPYECDALVRWETVNSTKRIRLTVKANPDSLLT
jgi:hypothetical protein